MAKQSADVFLRDYKVEVYPQLEDGCVTACGPADGCCDPVILHCQSSVTAQMDGQTGNAPVNERVRDSLLLSGGFVVDQRSVAV